MSPHLISILDQSLNVRIKEPSQPIGSVIESLDILDGLQPICGGQINQGHLKLGSENLYQLSGIMINVSCLLAPVYRAILDLKAFKDTRPNTGNYTQYRIDIIPFINRLIKALNEVATIRMKRAAEQADLNRIAHQTAKLERRETKKMRTAARRAQEKQAKQDAKAAKKAEAAILFAAGKKYCPKCDTVKSIDQFSGNIRRPDGHSMYCSTCCKQDYYLPNREAHSARTKQWLKDNPEAARAHSRKEKAKPHNRIRHTMSKRIKEYLKATKTATKWRDIVSCTPRQLVIHLESQFTGDMSWANYGTLWHIDHIIPCAAFDWARPKHLEWCWHHKNLRPLLATENIAKRDALSTGESAVDLWDRDLTGLKDIVGNDLERLGITTKTEYNSSWTSGDSVQYLVI